MYIMQKIILYNSEELICGEWLICGRALPLHVKSPWFNPCKSRVKKKYVVYDMKNLEAGMKNPGKPLLVTVDSADHDSLLA